MYKYLTIIIVLLLGLNSNSQINGITSTGEEVLLYGNRTWKYSNDSTSITKIDKNNKLFLKNKTSTFLIKSDKTKIGLWINPKNWSFSKAKPESAAEFLFKIKKKDIHGMLIAEKIEMPIENLVELAFDNAKEAASDVKIIKKEYRTVNDLEVIMMQLSGIIRGIHFVYYGYYYSSPNGSFQLVTYTSQNLFEKSKEDMEELLNGLVER